MNILGHPEVILEGYDLRLHDTREAYRQAVAQIKFDPESLGAVVTSHKIDLYEAARDMFDYSDRHAQMCGEVSSISKLDGRLQGHAFDPVTSGLSLERIIGKGYFMRGAAEVLCFGAGGSATATLLSLIEKTDPCDQPQRFIAVDRSQERLERMRAMVQSLPTGIQVELIYNQDPQVNDRIMTSMAPSSIVINATGMGKDIPGSPVSDAGLFPIDGVAWEFNYRGALDFLHQAVRQRAALRLVVADGWYYIITGWAQVVAQVLHIDLTHALFSRLEAAAETMRPQAL
jgi:shikimate 5-dehydrogenase